MSQRYLGGIITANPTAPTLTSASGVWTTEQQFQNIANWPKSTGLVSRSVRLRSSATAYFNRTPASATNRTTWTWSGWVKRGAITSDMSLFQGYSDANNYTVIILESADRIQIQNRVAATATFNWTTTAVYRDPSAWYNIVVAFDTTQSTSTDRIKLYVNGVQVTVFTTQVTGAQNATGFINNNNGHNIGRSGAASQYFDGYLTEINFIDGQALTPSYFGFTDGNGVWQPATYSGTYGTNGFYLNFSDNSGVTATTIGKDYSGNGNNWTPNNISVTAGATYDSMLDVPTPYADGGNGRGNYAVLNPLFSSSASVFTLSDGNLSFSATSAATASYFSRSAFGVSSGKWYWEVTPTAVGGGPNIYIGIQDATYSPNSGTFNQAPSAYVYVYDGTKLNNATSSAYGASYTNNDVIGVALDMDSGTITFYKNNSSQGTAYTGLVGTYSPAIGLNVGGASRTITGSFNAGQRPFTYTPPTGFVALNTQNLPTPTISNGAQYMAATTYTGTGASLAVSNAVNGVSFQPDFVWTKPRSTAVGHTLFDSLRGVTKYLQSNTTGAEGTAATSLTAFNSDGFTVNSDTSTGANGVTYVGWNWNAGGSTVTNTNGSISAQVRANATAGFSVVTYTGNATSGATVGHGLGVAPKMIIVKRRDAATNWPVWHTSISSGTNDFVQLNLTTAKVTDATFFTSTAPTSSVFSLGTGSGQTNTGSMVAYCFAAVAGYSAFGSYTGNGSADGPFVYLGFRPRFVMWKRTDAVANWFLMDSSRTPANPVNLELYADQTNAEVTFTDCDFLSNGFKLRTSDSSRNASGGTYIYAAFAENPFKLSRAR